MVELCRCLSFAFFLSHDFNFSVLLSPPLSFLLCVECHEDRTTSVVRTHIRITRHLHTHTSSIGKILPLQLSPILSFFCFSCFLSVFSIPPLDYYSLFRCDATPCSDAILNNTLFQINYIGASDQDLSLLFMDIEWLRAKRSGHRRWATRICNNIGTIMALMTANEVEDDKRFTSTEVLN